MGYSVIRYNDEEDEDQDEDHTPGPGLLEEPDDVLEEPDDLPPLQSREDHSDHEEDTEEEEDHPLNLLPTTRRHARAIPSRRRRLWWQSLTPTSPHSNYPKGHHVKRKESMSSCIGDGKRYFFKKMLPRKQKG